jgi:Skp family chaperone for outer membrane proteins
VTKLEQKLIDLKTKFTEETAAEQAELDTIKSKLQPAVKKMFGNQKTYQSAQGQLITKG